jgi:hypothetical protein
MEQAAAAAKAAREREQLFLRAASMGLLADVEALVAAGVDVSAVVRAAQQRTSACVVRSSLRLIHRRA